MSVTQPNSDFNKYEDKQKRMDESHQTGKGVYKKGDEQNAKGTTKKK